VQNTTDPVIAGYMLSHLRNLMEDAVSHGWEAVKAAHLVILTSLEAGTFNWADEYRMSDKRRSAITRASKEASVAPPVSASKFSNSRGQGRQGQSS
jgi:hypothetical protein